MSNPEPPFQEASNTMRFWVLVDSDWVGAALGMSHPVLTAMIDGKNVDWMNRYRPNNACMARSPRPETVMQLEKREEAGRAQGSGLLFAFAP